MIELFTSDESKNNLLSWFPGATQGQCDEFHELSNAIPRVQGYALKNGNLGLEGVLDTLRPGGKTVETLIDDNLRIASNRLGDRCFCEKICPAMLTLPRPVPIKYVALLTNTSEDAIKDFCVDMSPGIRLNHDRFSFADEDFENYLIQHFSPDSSFHESLADFLVADSSKESYAAAHIADVFQRLGRYSQLIGLIYKERQPEAITDPIQQKEVFARRARYAMEAAMGTRHNA